MQKCLPFSSWEASVICSNFSSLLQLFHLTRTNFRQYANAASHKRSKTRKNGGIFQLISSSQKLKLSPFNWFFKCVFHPFYHLDYFFARFRLVVCQKRIFPISSVCSTFMDLIWWLFLPDQELTSWRWILIQDFKSFSRFYSRFFFFSWLGESSVNAPKRRCHSYRISTIGQKVVPRWN